MKKISVFLLALFVCSIGQAASLGLSPQETYDLVDEQGEQLLFIDVRDPVEIMFVGSTDVVDANIPFMQANRESWDQDNNRFRMERNQDFAQQVEAALNEKGLDRNATVITMCRSGSERGEPSARYLKEQGFTDVRYVVKGFQGDPKSDGEQAGMRVVNGWQNSGLPWSRQMNADKIYRTN